MDVAGSVVFFLRRFGPRMARAVTGDATTSRPFTAWRPAKRRTNPPQEAGRSARRFSACIARLRLCSFCHLYVGRLRYTDRPLPWPSGQLLVLHHAGDCCGFGRPCIRAAEKRTSAQPSDGMNGDVHDASGHGGLGRSIRYESTGLDTLRFICEGASRRRSSTLVVPEGAGLVAFCRQGRL